MVFVDKKLSAWAPSPSQPATRYSFYNSAGLDGINYLCSIVFIYLSYLPFLNNGPNSKVSKYSASIFTKENNISVFLFTSLGNETLLRGTNSFLCELTKIKKGNYDENGPVASLESVPITNNILS